MTTKKRNTLKAAEIVNTNIYHRTVERKTETKPTVEKVISFDVKTESGELIKGLKLVEDFSGNIFSEIEVKNIEQIRKALPQFKRHSDPEVVEKILWAIKEDIDELIFRLSEKNTIH